MEVVKSPTNLFKNIFYGDQPLNIAVFIDRRPTFFYYAGDFTSWVLSGVPSGTK